MPGPLRTGAPGATAQEVDELKRHIQDLDQKLHAIANALDRRPNPAPAGDGFVMQMLLAEKDRNERLADKIAEYQNPLHQLEQLQALSNILPKADDGGNKVLEEVLSTVGGLVAAKMAQGAPSQGSEGSTDHYEEDGQKEY